MAVHARTLEIYSKLGIAERSLELGRRGTRHMWREEAPARIRSERSGRA